MTKYKSRLPYWVARLSMTEGGKRYTQQMIADGAGISRPTVSKWMNDEAVSFVDLNAAKALANFVGCQWYELLEEVTEESASLLRASAAV